mgnify:CR=1 FL=1
MRFYGVAFFICLSQIPAEITAKSTAFVIEQQGCVAFRKVVSLYCCKDAVSPKLGGAKGWETKSAGKGEKKWN